MTLTALKPASQPIAFLSDVHGNLPALEAVLSEIARRAIVDVYVAGDLLLGGGQPRDVWLALDRIGAHCIKGPSDVALAQMDPDALKPTGDHEAIQLDRFAETRKALGQLLLRRLDALPLQLRVPMIDGGEVLMVHGSPADPYEEISHDLDDEEVRSLLADDGAQIVICGATHVPFTRVVDDIEVVNVGSVGESPEGTIAHYTVLSPKVNGAGIEQAWVNY